MVQLRVKLDGLTATFRVVDLSVSLSKKTKKAA